jgi:soluble lytic murein transglycosylase-like protein
MRLPQVPLGRPRALVLLAAPLALAIALTASAPGWYSYRVRHGDTLWQLSRSHSTTVRTLQRANHLEGDRILVGQFLELPGAGGGASAAGASGTAAAVHVVRRGETLTALARRYRLTLDALARRNHLRGNLMIYVGQRLAVPGRAVTRTHAATRSRAAAVHAAELSGRAQPGRAEVRRLIRLEALRRGVDPALALAIASVESSFDQRAVSPVDAVGVMQLMPATARWLGEVLRRPIDRMHHGDNITGGVALLRLLLTRADLPTAIAAYYQGLGSVRRRGLLPETRRYVALVLSRLDHYRKAHAR